MQWKTIRSCGKVKVFHKKIPLSTGKIKTGAFLLQMMEEFAKVSTRAFDAMGNFPFAYKERQLSSILLPAFYNLGCSAIQEAPTRRREPGEECSAGWLDYWVQKEKKWVYLIEVKHGWQFFGGCVTKDTLNKIESSLKQLDQINGDALERLSEVESTFKMSLMVLPMYRGIPKGVGEEYEYQEFVTSLDEVDEFIGNAFMEKIFEATQESISWVGVWSLPSRMQYIFPRGDTSGFEAYPGIIFVATIVTN